MKEIQVRPELMASTTLADHLRRMLQSDFDAGDEQDHEQFLRATEKLTFAVTLLV